MSANQNLKRRDSLIAAFVTMLVVGVLLVWLLVATLRYDERLADSKENNPQLEEDELFLDPELLLEQHKDVGEPDAVANDAPAPEVKGEPAPAPVEQPHTVVSGENTVRSSEPKVITQKAESPVKTVEPDKKKEEEKVATSMAGKFSGKSGSVAGKFDSPAGSDPTGAATGISGKMAGREFLGCPGPDVVLSHKTVVTVSITVDAEGKVLTATASGAASRDIRKKCEQAAMHARWSAKKGAPSTRGTLTFTIIPK